MATALETRTPEQMVFEGFELADLKAKLGQINLLLEEPLLPNEEIEIHIRARNTFVAFDFDEKVRIHHLRPITVEIVSEED